jgi:hypothetical protein
MQRFRNVAYGQWRGARFYLHIGTTCWVFGDRPGYSGTGVELFTPCHWFRFRIGRKEQRS